MSLAKALTPRQREIAAQCYEKLRPHLLECPMSAAELGDKLGYFGLRESLRRRARDAIRWAREIYGSEIGSCADGYFLTRTRDDRIAAKDFLRGHGLSELHTASLKQPQQNQGSLL